MKHKATIEELIESLSDSQRYLNELIHYLIGDPTNKTALKAKKHHEDRIKELKSAIDVLKKDV